MLAEDGEEALGIVERETVHLMLLDMHMPRLNGLDTIRRVRLQHGLIPWILLSARLDDQLRTEAEAAEVSSVLPKPVSFKDITGAVSRALAAAYGWDLDRD